MCLWKNAIIWVITYPLGQIPPFLNALPYSVFLHTVHRDHLHANDLYSYFCNSIHLWEAVLQSAAPLSFRNPPIQILYIGVSLLTPLKNYFYLAVSDLCCSMWNLQLFRCGMQDHFSCSVQDLLVVAHGMWHIGSLVGICGIFIVVCVIFVVAFVL